MPQFQSLDRSGWHPTVRSQQDAGVLLSKWRWIQNSVFPEPANGSITSAPEAEGSRGGQCGNVGGDGVRRRIDCSLDHGATQ